MTDRYRRDRWLQLGFGFVAMMAVSSPQYVWTLLVGPIGKELDGSLAALQVTFLLLVVLQTFFSPFQAYLVERFGPRLLICAGAALTGLSWVLAAHASSIDRPRIDDVYRVRRRSDRGLAAALLLEYPLMFVLLTDLAFFGWGEIFSLFPSTLTDLFGPEHATTNYGILYIAQGVGSVLGGPVAASVRAAAGSWVPVFLIVVGLDILSALLAFFVLRRLRVQWLAQSAPAPIRAAAAMG